MTKSSRIIGFATLIISLIVSGTPLTSAFSFETYQQQYGSTEAQNAETIFDSITQGFNNGTFQSPIPTNINWHNYANTLAPLPSIPVPTTFYPAPLYPAYQAPMTTHENHDHDDHNEHTDEDDSDHDQHDDHNHAKESTAAKTQKTHEGHGNHDDGQDEHAGHDHGGKVETPIEVDLSAIKLATQVLSLEHDNLDKKFSETSRKADIALYVIIAVAILQVLLVLITLTSTRK